MGFTPPYLLLEETESLSSHDATRRRALHRTKVYSPIYQPRCQGGLSGKNLDSYARIPIRYRGAWRRVVLRVETTNTETRSKNSRVGPGRTHVYLGYWCLPVLPILPRRAPAYFSPPVTIVPRNPRDTTSCTLRGLSYP